MKVLRILAQVLAGVAGALLLAEGGLRLTWGRSTVQLPIYAEEGGAGIGLRPGASAEGRMPAGQRYAVAMDPRGLRAPAPPQPKWLLIGDSLPFGLGVDGDETAAAGLTAAGLPAAAAGVPAFSIADALAHAAALSPAGIVVLPNAVDDDWQGRTLLSAGHDVVGGWLLRRAAPGWARRFYRSSLSRQQLPTELMRLLSLLYRHRLPTRPLRPGWVTAADGGAAAWADVGTQIRAFGAEHPSVSVRVAWVPLPAIAAPGRDGAAVTGRLAAADGGWSDDAAVAGLRDGLGEVPLLDLRDAFAGQPSAYLRQDTHLSVEGNALLAAQLLPWLIE